MDKLDPGEFRRYLDVVFESDKPDNWAVDQACVKEFDESGALKHSLAHSARALLLLGTLGSFCSVWFTAFQMGREFESRRKEESELSKILKGGQRPE